MQPKQFYEIFPLIGALLGLFKLFSLVSMYNQIRFEKELQNNLTNKIENNADEENEIQKRLISFEIDVEAGALNKSTDHRSLI